MGVTTLYPNFTTDNSFGNTWQAIRASQYEPASTSKLNSTMSTTGISVHNIVQHYRDIYLSKSPSVKWFPNQPKVAS